MAVAVIDVACQCSVMVVVPLWADLSACDVLARVLDRRMSDSCTPNRSSRLNSHPNSCYSCYLPFS